MFAWLYHKHFYILIALGVITVVLGMVATISLQPDEQRVTTTVSRGTVQELVSVSGIANIEQTANLSFPVTGIVATVLVDEGDLVTTGDTLVTLETAGLQADRQDARAAIAIAIANRDELLAGPTDSSRTVTTNTVAQAAEALATTRNTEAQKVTNAYRALLSSNLSAYTEDSNDEAIPPTVNGTYHCDTEGQYRLEVYASNAASGYSYNLSGLETGTYPATTEQPAPLGDCGLEIQFDANSKYSRTNWIIKIPNTRSPLYVTNRNAYTLAVTQSESAIANAEKTLALAESTANDTNAPARSEAIARANAAITQARARLARTDATINDRILQAPFPGTITDVAVLPGETVSTAPAVTMVGANNFEVTARIPEIDIGKIAVGLPVELRFDARNNETLVGEISFIALTATEIDGVAYYEAIISLAETPEWIRSGLNADVEIIVNQRPNTLRLPTRFITETGDGFFVLAQSAPNQFATTSIEVTLQGNDGFSAITGLTEGDVVAAP